MLKTRLIPTLQLKNWGLVKSRQFASWRPIGPAVGRRQGLQRAAGRRADRPRHRRAAPVRARRTWPLLRDLADVCFMPFTAGGGVRSNEDVRALLHNGADKVSLNSAFIECPEVVECVRERVRRAVRRRVDRRARRGRLLRGVHRGGHAARPG